MTTHIVRTLCLGFLVLVGGCVETDRSISFPSSLDAELRQRLQQWGVVPIGRPPAQDSARVALGQALFFDKILSGNRDIACATCHNTPTSMGDGQSLAVGTGGTGVGPARQLGPGREFVPRNAPTLLNAGLGLFYMFWDGRISGHGAGPFFSPPDVRIPTGVIPNLLAAQALLPVLNRREMRGERGDVDVFGNPNELAEFLDSQYLDVWRAIVTRLLAIPEYEAMFRAAFPSTHPGTFQIQHVGTAIAAFLTAKFTRTDSPFDRYLARDDAALSAEAKRGALLFFREAQCATCHNGALLGGERFANVGVPQIGPGTGPELPLDLGRGGVDPVSQNQFYRFNFRVPPLRNVELTAPYMHNGAYATLENVVKHYDDVPLAMQTYDVSQLASQLRAMYHGEPSVIADMMNNLDFRFRPPLDLTTTEQADLVAFLRSLTDPAARDLSALTPARVPSGLPVP